MIEVLVRALFERAIEVLVRVLFEGEFDALVKTIVEKLVKDMVSVSVLDV